MRCRARSADQEEDTATLSVTRPQLGRYEAEPSEGDRLLRSGRWETLQRK